MQNTVDTERVEAFAGQILQDLGVTVSAALVYLGDRLGLYRALATVGRADSRRLAAATDRHCCACHDILLGSNCNLGETAALKHDMITN